MQRELGKTAITSLRKNFFVNDGEKVELPNLLYEKYYHLKKTSMNHSNQKKSNNKTYITGK